MWSRSRSRNSRVTTTLQPELRSKWRRSLFGAPTVITEMAGEAVVEGTANELVAVVVKDRGTGTRGVNQAGTKEVQGMGLLVAEVAEGAEAKEETDVLQATQGRLGQQQLPQHQHPQM